MTNIRDVDHPPSVGDHGDHRDYGDRGGDGDANPVVPNVAGRNNSIGIQLWEQADNTQAAVYKRQQAEAYKRALAEDNHNRRTPP
ncbi:MAG: hypothetical protein HYS18_01870 [Burkholderiales bacterium]|nr:hypothetical protein [Burkholderiales bacterium]